MSHQTPRRRNLAAPLTDPETSMDPTPHNDHHHHPDPLVNTSSTVQNISNHFSRLYLNHKARSFSHSQPNAKALSSISDSSTTASLTKSLSQRSRGSKNRGKPHYYYSNNYFKQVHEQEDSIKKAIVVGSTLSKKKEEIEEEDVAVVKKNNKGHVDLISADKEKGGLGDDGLKKPQQGYEIKMHSFPLIGMGKGKRMAFGSSTQAELADFFACSSVKVVSADMPPFMQILAVDVARKTYDSLEKFTAKTLALTLKKEFDVVYGPAWHCIVGSSFGSFVTHSVGGFVYFSMDQKLHVLLFKTTVQRAAAH